MSRIADIVDKNVRDAVDVIAHEFAALEAEVDFLTEQKHKLESEIDELQEQKEYLEARVKELEEALAEAHLTGETDGRLQRSPNQDEL